MILVAYASKYSATQEIAERIAGRLIAVGQHAEVRPIRMARDLSRYDAFVLGSATYLGHWLKEAVGFVRSNRAVLVTRPVWLFSSGPLGTQASDAKGRDMRAAAEPEEIDEFRKAIHPRDHRVFFGALDPGTLGLRDRLIRSLPAGRPLLPEGDFRNWAEIEAWATTIARDLAQAPAGRGTGAPAG
jgi:menaquinone-dependent protoporphyrinogen oxidase